MKGITNNHPSFARICLCILCAACISFSASAQNKSVKVNVKDVTVKELLKAIEAGSTYKFAYVDTDIDLSGKLLSMQRMRTSCPFSRRSFLMSM